MATMLSGKPQNQKRLCFAPHKSEHSSSIKVFKRTGATIDTFEEHDMPGPAVVFTYDRALPIFLALGMEADHLEHVMSGQVVVIEPEGVELMYQHWCHVIYKDNTVDEATCTYFECIFLESIMMHCIKYKLAMGVG